MKDGVVSLDDLFAPLGVARWREQHLGVHAVRLRSPGRRWGSLATLEAETLRRQAPPDHLDVIQGGVAQTAEAQPLPSESSLRIKRLQVLDEGVRHFAVGIATALGEEVNVNLYASPSADTPGLAPHVDPYDVLVIQLSGRKDWELLGDPDGRLPPEPLKERDGLIVGNRGSLELAAGDVLYLPRGVMHRAHNPGPEPSVHLALSLLVKTTRSVIDWLSTELERRVDASRPLPLGSGDEEQDRAISELRTAAEAILTSEDRLAAFRTHRQIVEYEGLLLSPRDKEARPRR